MSINPQLATALNEQITMELEASMVYLQMSYITDDLSLPGMTLWLKKQHAEELEHAEKFAQHLLDRDYTPQIGDINPPKVDASSPLEIFELALAHEQKVSASIRELAILSDSIHDFESRPLLNTFVTEQVEEEASVREILDRLRLAGEGLGVLYIDDELSKR
ncbi:MULTISPECIES: ferritin [unclassified Corynebacterium]|uniref:ferritin n=1 Tax=unclassified Corynebacterium TaxID=2624378 RepID=UPI00216AA931|nr:MULTISPECIES: ferritin [unclassified Corynebacterium]MCS4492441.1 ferritin [Corynebacterium sp. ES2715-CONJ3]MCS4532595.1 ferritin [Corynebacterium sp. ES2730-CONJ]